MNAIRVRAGMGVMVLSLAVADGVANAQDAPARTSTELAEPNAQQVPLDQMKTRAEAIIGRIQAVEGQVGAMLLSAKEDRQVVRVLCLTDKSNQVALALGTAKDRQSSLLAALSRGADGRARHEYRLLAVVGENVENLSAEANLCLGGEAGPVGESSLDVDIDPNLPAPDPGVVPLAPIVALVPLVASPSD